MHVCVPCLVGRCASKAFCAHLWSWEGWENKTTYLERNEFKINLFFTRCHHKWCHTEKGTYVPIQYSIYLAVWIRPTLPVQILEVTVSACFFEIFFTRDVFGNTVKSKTCYQIWQFEPLWLFGYFLCEFGPKLAVFQVFAKEECAYTQICPYFRSILMRVFCEIKFTLIQFIWQVTSSTALLGCFSKIWLLFSSTSLATLIKL